MEKTIKPPQDRIEIIDILRGFALLGIIIVHFTEQYYAGQAPDSQASFGIKNLADQITQAITGIFVQGKFFMIFSFLFGLSFYIQFDKSSRTSPLTANDFFAFHVTPPAKPRLIMEPR